MPAIDAELMMICRGGENQLQMLNVGFKKLFKGFKNTAYQMVWMTRCGRSRPNRSVREMTARQPFPDSLKLLHAFIFSSNAAIAVTILLQ